MYVPRDRVMMFDARVTGAYVEPINLFDGFRVQLGDDLRRRGGVELAASHRHRGRREF